MQYVIIVCLLVAFSFKVSASGDRDLLLSESQIKALPTLQVKKLPAGVKYLGSTKEWHLFAETLTAVSKGMPFSNTFGYKVNANGVDVVNGWQLNQENTLRPVYVNNCPKLYSIKSHENETVIIIPENQQGRCLGND